jgi:putative RecB family exonuclease
VRLSYSAISTYQKCPLSYKFLYVDKLPTRPSHYLSFGNTIHSVLEFFYKTGPAPIDLKRLLEELDNQWLHEGYENDELEIEYKEKGRSILTQFYNDNIETFAPPLAVEKRFGIDVGGVTVSGIIDRIDRLPNGDLEIIDYKTNAKLPPKTRIASDLQLPIYHMAAQELFGIAPKKVTLYFLVPNKKMSAQKTEADIDRTRKTILDVAGRIGKQKFDPSKNSLCAWCDFIELCPLYKNNPAMLAKAAANGKISGNVKNTGRNSNGARAKVENSIEGIVDEYFELVQSIRKSRERLVELQTSIHNHCEMHDIGTISGSKGMLKRGAQRTTHYNIDKLRELLEPRGLWENIIDVNGSFLKSLIENEPSRGEIAGLVESAKEMEEISYYLSVIDER